MHIEETLMKLNIYIYIYIYIYKIYIYISFLIKDDELLEKYNEICEKVKIESKENLMVNLYTMKTN